MRMTLALMHIKICRYANELHYANEMIRHFQDGGQLSLLRQHFRPVSTEKKRKKKKKDEIKSQHNGIDRKGHEELII